MFEKSPNNLLPSPERVRFPVAERLLMPERLPESSSMPTEFLINFPVVKLYLTKALAVDEAGPTTSPEPLPPPVSSKLPTNPIIFIQN